MDDYNDSALDDYQDSLNDLKSLKGHLDSIMSSYKKVENYGQKMNQQYADLEKCAKDYKNALELLLKDYGELLTYSLNREMSEDDIKQRIQDKLEHMKQRMGDDGINLQYQIPGEQYVEPTDNGLSNVVYTTDMNLDGVVQKIGCIGLSSRNIKEGGKIRESTYVYRYRDSSDSSISNTSAKEGASKAAALAPSGSPVEDPRVSDGRASCAVRKDGGDDIDATHGTFVYSEVPLSEEGIPEETSHEADSTNQTDENRHVLADVDAPLCLIRMDRNSDGKYELPLSNELILVGISDPTSPDISDSPSQIAGIKVPSDWDIATDLKITLTEDDGFLTLNATEGIDLSGSTQQLSYGTCFLNIMKEDTQNTGHRGTVTYKKTKKPIEYFAHATNIEKAKNVKLGCEIKWELPKPFIYVDGCNKYYYYHPSMDEPHWKTESTNTVLKYIADYRMEDFEEYVHDLCQNMGTKECVIAKIPELILTSRDVPEISEKSIMEKVNSIWTDQKKS